MTNTSEIGPISQQYSAAATVPLIKSPSLWLPKPVELPNDVHPLPEDITAYFVYPFTLEEHVLSLHPSPHEAIAQRRARNAAVLHQRELEEEQKEREALHRVAPGYNPAALLLPTSKPTSVIPAVSALDSVSTLMPQSTLGGIGKQEDPPSTKAADDPMDELVRSLEEMESRR